MMIASKFVVRIVLWVLIQSLICPVSYSILLDIHLPLNPSSTEECVYNEALRWNKALQEINEDLINENGEQIEFIDFVAHHTPHVTLYLADFNIENELSSEIKKNINQTKLDALTKAIKDTVIEFKDEIKNSQVSSNLQYPCKIEISEPIVSAAYTMLDIRNNECLQLLSDRIVSNTKKFVHFPSPVPDWVYTIKDMKKREEKIELIQKYGSPNVFDGFEPHVTVSYEENVTNESIEWRESMVKELQTVLPSECTQEGDNLALGYTSLGGTVVQGPIIDIGMELFKAENHASVHAAIE